MPRKKSKSRFLTAKEELRLIRTAQSGAAADRKYRERRTARLPECGVDRELQTRVRNGIAAKQTLVERNHGFLWLKARELAKLARDVLAEELIGEATLAYMAAILRFDEALGYRLNTYAGRPVWQAMCDHVNRSRGAVCVPKSALHKMNDGKLAKKSAAQVEEAMRKPLSLSGLPDEHGESTLVPVTAPDEDDESLEHARLRLAVAKLPTPERRLIERVLQGESERDIAAATGRSINLVRDLHANAVRLLRRLAA